MEDERHLQRDIVDELVAAGYEAIGASDGSEALALLATLRPRLILCDVAMPRLNGYEFLDAVRRGRPDLADVPFVFLTAFDQRDAIINGKRAGADDYLVKPIDYDLMLATVEARLRQVGRIDRKRNEEVEALRKVLADDGSEQGGSLRQVLDVLSFGIVVVSSSGVEFANRAARAIHQAQDGLIVDQTLHTGSPLHDGAVRMLLSDACDAAREGSDHLASVSVPRLSGRRDLLLTACALPDSSRASVSEPQAVVFITDPERRPTVSAKVLCGLFDLTPTEAEVARALTRGRRTEEIARDLSVAQTTVAFHLRNLFDKTGTHRQADLVALLLTGLASIENPSSTDGEPGC